MERNGRFKVALTFAGEQRDYVRRVAARLVERIGRENVFYDEYYEAELARPNLDLYLSDIYRSAELLVPFFSAEYEQKPWCRLEWRVVRTVLFERRSDDVMLCRFDKTEVGGLFPIDGCLDLWKYEPEETADLIFQRLALSSAGKIVTDSTQTTSGPTAKPRDNDRNTIKGNNQIIVDKRTININIHANLAEPGHSESGKVPQHLLTVLGSEIGQYASILSRELRGKLEHIHEKYRQGKVEDAYNDCGAIRANTELWQKLGATDQATVLLRLARYALDLEASADEIRELMAQAKALDASLDDTIVRVMLCSREHGADAGLSELGEPRTITAFNLRLSLLFQANRYDDVLAALQVPPVGVAPDTESDRFHALALLAKGDLAEAREKIKQALSEHGDWEFVQITAAMIDYWSGMAAGLMTPRVVAAPAPIGLALAKSDPESLRYFKKAEQRFAALIENTQRDNDQRKCFETWRLASLANDPTRQQDAATYSHELLTRDPAHHRVLLWAMVYNYLFDAQSSETALKNGLNEAVNTDEGLVIEIATTLCALYLSSGKREEAQSLLDRTKEYFVRNNAGDVWAFWQIQRMLADKEFEEAQRVAAQAEDMLMRRRLETLTLRAQSIETNDFSALARHLETSFQETGDPHYLLEFCELSFELRDWETIVKYAQQLIESAGNINTVGLAALACWNSGRHISVLTILERHAPLFLEQRLPDYLWRLKIMSLLRSGRTSEAVTEAKTIAQSAPTTDNLRTCVDACVQMGDLRKLQEVALQLISRNDVPFETLARMAGLLSRRNPELAKQYLLRACDGLLEYPQYAAFIYYISSRLGLEREIGPIFRQIVENHPTEVTGVWTVPIKEFPKQQRQMWEKRQWTTDQYGKGSLPLHLVAANGDLSLVEWLHVMPESNRKRFAPRQRMAIYARHGGHLVKTHLVENSDKWRIHADITSLILAESLEILDKVEEAFGPIVISPNVQPSLIWQMNHLSPQASRVKICQNILRLRDEEKFRLASPGAEEMASSAADSQIGNRLLALMRKAQDEGGYVVTYLPLITLEGQPVTIPSELADHVVNCRAVLESLKEQGWLNDSEYDEARYGLGSEGRKEALGPILTEGAKLFLDGNIAETLEGAGLLSDVCERFDVYVDEQQIEWAKQQKWLNEDTEELQNWMSRLIERLRAGLESGKYRTISIPDVLPDEMREALKQDSLETRCFDDLLLLEPQAGDVIWTDDRFFNRHPAAGNNVPIIAISEVLSALRLCGKLNESKYYEKLLALRTGNFRYIPLDQFEILHHLKGIKLKPKEEANERDEIIETKDLKKLRRSIAASLLDQGRLEPISERWFLHSVGHTVKAAILLLWKDENISIERARACSNWIFENLFVSPLGFIHLFDPAMIQQSFADALGEVLGDYLASGVFLNQDGQTENLRQHAYFEWLNDRLLSSCFNAHGQTIAATASQFRAAFRDVSPAERSEEYLEVLIFWMLLHLRLPEDVAEAMGKELAPDAEACKKVGLSPFDHTALGPISFQTEALINAFEKAWLKGSATIKAIGGGESCIIVKGGSFESREESFYVEIPAWKLRLQVLDEVWKLLSEDASVREQILRRNRWWFDCDQQTFEREIKRIAALESFYERVDSVQKIRQQSMAAYYHSLPERLNSEPSLAWFEMMPPSIPGLLRHYRLAAGDREKNSIAERLTQSAKVLLEEEGLRETLDRFACLSVRVPEPLVAELGRLPRGEKIELLRSLGKGWVSPISNLHLIDLVLRAGDGEEDFLAVARFALDRLFVEEKSDTRFSLFLQTLRLVSVGLGRLSDPKQLDVATKLLMVWSHAARLHNVCEQIGNGAAFSWANEWSKWESVFADSAYLNDAVHPQRISRPVFLTHGLSAIFTDQDKKLTDSLNVAQLLTNVAFTKSGERQVPVSQFLFDSTLLLNQTESFLGGDKSNSIRALLGDATASLPSPVDLRRWIAETIERIATDTQEIDEWVKILLATDGLPLQSELAESFRAMVENLDLLALYKNDPEAAAIAIRVIAAQLAYPRDEILLRRFEDDVLQIILRENGQSDSGEKNEQANAHRQKIGGVTLEVAVRMIFRDATKPGEPRGTEGLLFKLVEYAAQFRDLIPIHGLIRVIHEMPPDKAWQLWPILLAARAAV